jgi:hypothetical protein
MAAVAAAADNSAAWFTLVGALGGVLLTSAVALATAVLNHRWQAQRAERELREEHVRQLRQERRETYLRYWSAWNRLNHQLRTLRAEVQKLGTPPDAKSQLTKAAPEVVEQAWTLELEWREAADGLLLIGGRAVVEAALAHIEAMDRRLERIWQGEWHPDPGGKIYRALNDAMRSELLQPTRP